MHQEIVEQLVKAIENLSETDAKKLCHGMLMLTLYPGTNFNIWRVAQHVIENIDAASPKYQENLKFACNFFHKDIEDVRRILKGGLN